MPLVHVYIMKSWGNTAFQTPETRKYGLNHRIKQIRRSKLFRPGAKKHPPGKIGNLDPLQRYLNIPLRRLFCQSQYASHVGAETRLTRKASQGYCFPAAVNSSLSAIVPPGIAPTKVCLLAPARTAPVMSWCIIPSKRANPSPALSTQCFPHVVGKFSGEIDLVFLPVTHETGFP